MRGTISATASNVPDEAVAQIVGLPDTDQQIPFTHAYRLELPHGNDGCVYRDESTIEDAVGGTLQFDLRVPLRTIPGLDDAAAGTSHGGEVGVLLIDQLEGSGSIVAVCDEEAFTVPYMHEFIPMWFNLAHAQASGPGLGELPSEALLAFPLTLERGGSLVATYDSTEPLVDPSDPTTKVERVGEVRVYHTPTNMPYPEPPPPS